MQVLYYEIDPLCWKDGIQLIRKRLKTKIDIILLLLETMKYLAYAQQIRSAKELSLCLYVDAMSRLFFFEKNKYFSFAFPFAVLFDEGTLYYSCRSIKIDQKMISMLYQYFNDMAIGNIVHIQDIERNDDILSEKEFSDCLIVITELLQMEPGYIRYDHDVIGYESNGRSNLHPLYHFDVNYSDSVTYKVGLKQQLSCKNFISFLDNKEIRRYIQ